MAMNAEPNVVVLVGGVGGAKLALGLQEILSPERLTVVVNTGDDFWHYGLRISPDVDTVLYTLSGRVNLQTGWGVMDDTTVALETLRSLGEDVWFRLGDKDIATHLLRANWLRDGVTLTEIVTRLAQKMGVAARILPMSDDFVETRVDTVEYGEIEFQEYFVKHRWQPVVRGLFYDGSANASLTPQVRRALDQADVILVGPSNPWLSIAPILAIPGMSDLLRSKYVPRVAVTPIVSGRAIKGPAAKIMRELSYEVSADSVITFYGDVINGFVYDERDEIQNVNRLKTLPFDTMMTSNEKKAALARAILNWVLGWEPMEA